MDRRYADNAETPTRPFAVNALIASDPASSVWIFVGRNCS
jgi:hypothetical protein